MRRRVGARGTPCFSLQDSACQEGRPRGEDDCAPATGFNFQPTGGGKATITGDFVMRGSAVNEVIGALLGGGIEVSALHNHMLTEEPRLFSMHSGRMSTQ